MKQHTKPVFRLSLLWIVISALPVLGQDADNSGGPLESLAPTRAEASVAPVETAVRDMPPLPPPILNPAPLKERTTVAVTAPVEVPLPTIPPDAVTPPAMVMTGDQVYFDATLGGGSVSSILGSINVYRLGSGPEFRVAYDHRGQDGFNFEQPGSGFFQRTNDLSAWLRLGAGSPVSAVLEADYADDRFGLQQLSPYYSQDLRTFNGLLDVHYAPNTVASIGGSIDLSNTQRVLSTGDSDLEVERNTYTRLEPAVFGTLEWARFRINLTGSYEGVFPGGLELKRSSVLDLRLGVETVPFDGLTLGISGATMYRLDDGVYFPLEGYLSYQGSERWDLRIAGGIQHGVGDPSALWSDYPLLAVEPGTVLGDTELPTTESVFASGELGIVLLPGRVSVHGGATIEQTADRLLVTEYDQSARTYSFEIGDTETLEATASMEWNIAESVTLDLGWSGLWGHRQPGVAAHTVNAGISAEVKDLTLDLSGEAPVRTGGTVLPIFDIEGAYRFTRDVDFMIFAYDVLAPMMDDGRTLRGIEPDDDDPVIGAGIEVGAAVRVRF